MCGIVGFANFNKPQAEAREILTKMLSYIEHRGPDEFGYYLHHGTGLGSARLSIVDLSNGKQPVSDASKRYRLVFNGEIYNFIELRAELEKKYGYIFTNNSDTEVIAAAWSVWGSACLENLNGAFAFAIFDTLEKTLFIARDRFGKKPIYYLQHNNSLYFASELKSFFAINDFHFSIDSEQLASVFRVWVNSPNDTYFEGIKPVPPGSFLRLRDAEVTITHYYQPDFSNWSGISTAEARKNIKSQLEESVKIRLRGDVSVACYLSGGLDSTIITSLASHYSAEQLSTFSVGFESEAYDESSMQNIVSKHYGTKHFHLNVTEKMIADSFHQALYYAETPVFRTAFVPMYLLSKLVHHEGYKVVLTGEGADEIFMGYNIFKETILREQWEQYSESERGKRLQALYPYLPHFNEANIKSQISLFQQFLDTRSESFSHDLRFHNTKGYQRFFTNKYSGDHALDNIINYLDDNFSYRSLSKIKQAQLLEINTLLSGYLLSTQGDRMSMANSVETRCPFLDPVLAAYAFKLPTDITMPEMREKALLKSAFANELPREVLQRHKQPYRAPNAISFLKRNNQLVNDYLNSKNIEQSGLFNPSLCERFINKLMHSERISPRDDNLFLLLLSTMIMDDYFVKRSAERRVSIDALIMSEYG